MSKPGVIRELNEGQNGSRGGLSNLERSRSVYVRVEPDLCRASQRTRLSDGTAQIMIQAVTMRQPRWLAMLRSAGSGQTAIGVWLSSSIGRSAQVSP